MKHRFQKTTILWLSLCTLLCTSGLTACESKPEPIKDYIIAETETPTEPDVFQAKPCAIFGTQHRSKNSKNNAKILSQMPFVNYFRTMSLYNLLTKGLLASLPKNYSNNIWKTYIKNKLIGTPNNISSVKNNLTSP